MEWFYDNLCSPLEEERELLEVERIYCLDFNQFNDDLWQTLTSIYDQLPERKTSTPDGCPWWFGTDEESGVFLWASVEPSGLQVYGVVRPDDWADWDARFRSLAVDLPKRDIG